MLLRLLLFLSASLYVYGSPGESWLENLTKDGPCQGPTRAGFDNPDEDDFGFVTHRDMTDGETFSGCWSMEFYEGHLALNVMQIAFYHHNVTSEDACIQIYSGSKSMYVSNLLIGIFCGSLRPPLLNVSISPATILYHTNNTRTGQNFEAIFNVISADEQCGGILTALEGVITSVDRDEDGLYDPHLGCSTIIAAPKGFVIEIIFIHFNLTKSSFCMQDHVIIMDTGTFSEDYCGDTIPPRITTTTNIVRVLFRSSYWNPFKTTTHSGFLARYSFINEKECYHQVNETVGYIEYMDNDDPGTYEPLVVCTWTIQADRNKMIQLALTYLDIPSTDGCKDNRLEIQNATGLYGVYCGSEPPILIKTTYSHMTLKLQLTTREAGAGFKCIYTIVTISYSVAWFEDWRFPCGALETESPRRIYQPFLYKDGPHFVWLYGVDLDCTWTIIAPVGYQIMLEFTFIDIEGQYPCPYDYIEVIGSYYTNGSVVFPRICGSELPGKITSPSNILYVRFVTDYLYSGLGFDITEKFTDELTESCGGEMSESVDTFGLILNDLQMGSRTACHWVIDNSQKQNIELKIFRLFLPDDDTCESAFVELYDESGSAGKFCGIGSQPVKVFTTAKLHIYFIANNKHPGHGFEATYSLSDGIYTYESRIMTLEEPQFFNSPDTYKVDRYDRMLDLQWTIILEPGKIVQLFFLLFDVENSMHCLYDRLKVFDGLNDAAPLVGTYCGTSAPKKVRSTSNVLYITFFADGTRNAKGFNISFSQAQEFAWRQWPDYEAYSIPKSVYGCPEQSVNEWAEGYIDFKVKEEEETVLLEKSLGQVTKEKNLLTIGPYQSDGFRLSFCTKRQQIGTGEWDRNKEWPRGNYAIFGLNELCPKGFWQTTIDFRFGFKYSFTNFGMIPSFELVNTTIWESQKLRFWFCLKKRDMDTVTFASDLRAPFMVIPPEFVLSHRDDVRQLYRNFAEDSMLGHNTSMKVVEESFRLELRFYESVQSAIDLFSFWIVLPIEPETLFREQQETEIPELSETETPEPSTWALGLPDDTDDNLLWLLYNLGQRVFVTGIRLVKNGDSLVTDYNDNHLNIPLIMISNDKWTFLENGAFFCLPFEIRSNATITVYCVNDPYIMSTRFVTLKAVHGDKIVLEGLLNGSWSIWLLSHKESATCGQSLGMESGYIEDFQLTATSEDELFPKNNGRPGNTGWCYMDQDMNPYFQVRHPMEKEETLFHIDPPVLARTVSFIIDRFDSLAGTRCFKFELYGCRMSGLKNMNCANSKAVETYRSKEMLVNYFFDLPDSSFDNKTLSECSGDCLNANSRCAVALSMEKRCEWYLSSTTHSYGSVLVIGKDQQAAIQICPTEKLKVRTSAYITSGISWDEVTTLVQEPGFIVSHDYPFIYSSGEFWVWDIHFNMSTNIHIIIYNASFNKHQIFQHLDGDTSKFSDHLDRLYITNGRFDLNLVFSEANIHASVDLIAVLDKDSGHIVPHYTTDPGNIRVIWRTIVQVEDSRDSQAVGFRMLAFTTDKPICQSSATVCEMLSADINSKSFIGEYPSYTETWTIKTDKKRFIFIEFTEFDIGCGSGSKLELVSSNEPIHSFCNQNKPINSVRSSQTSLTVRFTFENRDGYLIEGFRAVYEFQVRHDALLSKPVLEETVGVDGPQTAPKVCSEQFRKCYILIDELSQRYNTTRASWLFASTSVCETNDWSLVSLHSELEQEFVVTMLLNKLNFTNMEHTYIGLRREVSTNAGYSWTDNTTLTYTAWKKNEPTSSVSYSCTRMSLKMAENSEWESCECDTPAASVAVCQHAWNDADSDKINNATERPQKFKPLKVDFNPLSMFQCDNGEIISLLGQCDGNPDCADFSDERNCTNSTDGCTTLQYQCRDGQQCISVNKMCDFYLDCQDSSDENCYFPHCSESTEFTCNNHRCINSSVRCDGKDDCRDNSDELNCVEYNCFRRSFPCSSSQCISFSYVCDGVQDCWNGLDELNCQFPQSCSAWWNAGYQKDGVYNIGEIDVECDFGDIQTDRRVVSKFHHTDYVRLLSRVSNFSYTSQDSLRRLINDNDCYQDIDQLCHSWVQELYNWDDSVSKMPNASNWNWSRIHPCFCIRHGASLTKHKLSANNSFVYKDCDGNDLPLLPEMAFHVMVNQSNLYGYIQSMQLKRGHAFDISRLKLVVHPIRCYSEVINITSKLPCGHGFSTEVSTKCLYKLDVFGHIIGCRSLQHLQNCEEFECPNDFFKCSSSFCIEKQFICDGIPQCENAEDEHNCGTFSCESQYRCLQSRICLPQKYICDGYPHCQFEDDEKLCNFICPEECSCQGFVVNCTHTAPEDVTRSITISPFTRLLDVSNNSVIYHNLSLESGFVNNLIYLNISSCRISILNVTVFENFINLRILDLSHNQIRTIPSTLFLNIQKLENLSLSFNSEILTIETEAFKGLDSIAFLDLESLRVGVLSKAAFAFLNLDILDLSGNIISKIDNNAFEALRTKRLYLNGTRIDSFGSDLFKGLEQIDYLITDDFKFCCVRPYYLSEDKCLPRKNHFSSCDDLMRNGILRSFIWIIGVFALLGNAASVFYHIQFDRKRLKLGYGIFVTNLAISDFVMGLYLIIVAVADMVYRGEYILYDESWRHSGWCKLAGVFALLASETSIFFMCLITLDRILVIKYPFSENRFTTKPALEASFMVWVIGLIISVIPLVFTSYFENEFFSKTGVCLALPLTRERGAGWLYSVFIFIIFNFLTFLLIAWGQWLIYAEVTSDKRPTAKSAESRKKELRVARNLLLVVLTDFLCWFPIGLLGILAITGTTIPGDVYAWTAVFILPVNSALNPFLYTLSAILGKKTMVPDTEEHEKTLTFLKTEIENIFNVWREPGICNKPPKGYIPLPCLSSRKLNLRECIHIAKGILESLIKLHKVDIAQKDLALADVYIRALKGRCDVVLNCQPQLDNKQKVKAENIKSFGELFMNLLDNSQVL